MIAKAKTGASRGSKLIGVYPGTFDPIHMGHLDIIQRATRVVDHLVVAVASNVGKGPLFTSKERLRLVRDSVAKLESHGASVEVVTFSNLLVHFARDIKARVIVRGLRAVSDFEYEFQMSSMNARLAPGVETVFLTASERQQFISSRFVKEIAILGGDIRSFVPVNVAAALAEKCRQLGGKG